MFVMKNLLPRIYLIVLMVMPWHLHAVEQTSQISQTLSAGYFLKLGLALLLVLAMFMAFAWVMRKFNGYQTTAKGELQVVTGLNLGTREKLVVVQVGDEQLLLGVTPGKISRLHQLEQNISTGGSGSVGDFSDKLKTLIQKKAD